ncbi:uncharacterized protein KGF55_003305 [Candida pseudojiufengensis]|uniref:uncharacterized protein n=1 Tax=Candida pseudojiufengensis TaxID=497109 RepID=UPI00222515D9|nr:uncharacterized protein KGF55_003305 [Candida pseudojiufengensis]KAI5962229.1 hypothetical protein KGF55_003305 [Candida pseudojiufengensis]
MTTELAPKPQDPEIKPEPSQSIDPTNLPESEIDSKSLDEIQILYNQLQEKFKIVFTESNRLFENERNQRKTLAYYQRRNQAILDILEKFEEEEENEENGTKDDDTSKEIENNRIKQIISKVPRLKNTLSKLIDSDQFKPDSNTLLNLYLIEKIPDLVNDEFISLEINPQSADLWCNKNTPFINGDYKPITLETLNNFNEYSGTKFDLGVDGKLIITPQAASSSSKKRRRK